MKLKIFTILMTAVAVWLTIACLLGCRPASVNVYTAAPAVETNALVRHIWINCVKLSTDVKTLAALDASHIYVHAELVELIDGTNGLNTSMATNSRFMMFINKP